MNNNFSVKHFAFLLSALLFFSAKNTNQQHELFNKYFEAHSLRIDYTLIGDANSEMFVLQQIKKTEHWAGKKTIISYDSLNVGNFRFNLYDSATNKLLYTKGFSSLFEEWQSTPEAKNTKKSFYLVNLMPFPKNTVKYQLQKRNSNTGSFESVQVMYVNPSKHFILNETYIQNKHALLYGTGQANNKIDIAFLAEGYKKNEMTKFKKDVKRMWNYFITIPPFNQYKDKFNIYAVQSISEESGVDNPGVRSYKNTALNFSFYTFNSERYLTSFDLKAMHDVADVVPYDQIFVLVNTDKYGGGGFLNYYSATSVDNELSLKVGIHEFGHGFAGLADEYYNNNNNNNEFEGFYKLNIEPWEPNITTLVNFDTKWANMVKETTPIPTKREPAYNYEVGVFEGGAYSAKGIYSPYQNCRMKSNTPRGFCPVCSRAIIRTILWYCD